MKNKKRGGNITLLRGPPAPLSCPTKHEGSIFVCKAESVSRKLSLLSMPPVSYKEIALRKLP